MSAVHCCFWTAASVRTFGADTAAACRSPPLQEPVACPAAVGRMLPPPPVHAGELALQPIVDRGGWAGSPAASSPTGPRPSAPLPWPSGWAASTRLRPSWAPPGRRCAKPSSATTWACRPPTPKPSACGPSTRPASAPGGRLPRPWTRCSWHSTRAPSPPVHGRRLSCTSGSPRRAVRHLGASVVVKLYSESHARRPTTRAWAIIRRADRSDRLADQRTSRADRRQAEAPHGPRTDHSRSRSGDARRCPLTPLASAV